MQLSDCSSRHRFVRKLFEPQHDMRCEERHSHEFQAFIFNQLTQESFIILNQKCPPTPRGEHCCTEHGSYLLPLWHLFPPGLRACIPPSLLSQGVSPLFPSAPNNPGNLLNPEGTVHLTHPHQQPSGRKNGNRQPPCLGEQEAWAGAVASSMEQIAVLHP